MLKFVYLLVGEEKRVSVEIPEVTDILIDFEIANAMLQMCNI